MASKNDLITDSNVLETNAGTFAEIYNLNIKNDQASREANFTRMLKGIESANDAGGDDLTELKAKFETNKANAVKPVTSETFLASILPQLAQGERWCAVSIAKGKAQQSFHDSIEGLLDASNNSLQSERDSYYSMATYEQLSEGKWNRKKESVRYFKCLWIDLDSGNDTTYATQTDGVKALNLKTAVEQKHKICKAYIL